MNTEIIGECLRGNVTNGGSMILQTFINKNLADSKQILETAKDYMVPIIGVTNLDMLNNEIELEKTSDAVIVDALTLTFNSVEDISVFYETIKTNNIYFKIYTNNYNIMNINLELLIELDSEIIDETTIIIKIPNILNTIELIALKNEKVYVSFDEFRIIKNIIATKIYLFNHIYEVEVRKKLCTKKQYKYNEEIIGGTLNINKNNCSLNICSESCSKGFFVLSDNLDDLDEIKFQTYKKNRLLYDKVCLKKYCIRVSKNLLYVPFNPTIKQVFPDDVLNSYISCVPFGRYTSGSITDMQFYNTDIKMKFSKKITRVGVYLFGLNCIIYDNGELSLLGNNYLNIKENNNLLFENNIKYIKNPNNIGFWKKPNNPDKYCYEIPVENSATENQENYIAKLKDLQNEIHDGNMYFAFDKCVICNKQLKYHVYKFDDLTWYESYIHYLEEHNVKIDDKLCKILNKN